MAAEPHLGGRLHAIVGDMLDGTTGRSRHRRLPTRFDPLDDLLGGGLRTGDLTILGGRPGTGKTALVLQWARAAVDAGATVVVASLEHDAADLLERLLLLELGELAMAARPAAGQARRLVSEVLDGQRTWADVVTRAPELQGARAELERRSPHLHLACDSDLAITDLREIAVQAADGRPLLVVIDYLQKVADAHRGHDPEDVTRACKSLALDLDAAVLAVSSTDTAGLTTERVRLSHLRGAAAIAFEADVALILEDKLQAVSRLHSAYDERRAAAFRELSVLLMEKHRRGLAGIATEYRRELGFSRFDPRGTVVSERLADTASTSTDGGLA